MTSVAVIVSKRQQKSGGKAAKHPPVCKMRLSCDGKISALVAFINFLEKDQKILVLAHGNGEKLLSLLAIDSSFFGSLLRQLKCRLYPTGLLFWEEMKGSSPEAVGGL